MRKGVQKLFAVCGIAACAGMAGATMARAVEIPLTIVHTNDLHSHFDSEKSPIGLGGIARIATTFARIRDQEKNTLFLDGGDFTEGHIYYNLGAGLKSLQMMNMLGYDAIVVGNHDWYNGVEALGDIITKEPPRFALLGANLEIPDDLLAKLPALKNDIKPYTIITRGGIKIGIIGIVNFEGIYDKLALPAKPQTGFPYVRKYAKFLKEQEHVDFLIVMSHNNLYFNQIIAGMKYVDLVIHSHDHEKYPKPIGVTRNGKLALMVETGCWGHYVGKLDLLIDPEKKTWRMKHYGLIQMDSKVPPEPRTIALLNSMNHDLEQRYGDIFNDKVVDLGMDLRREGDLGESVITNVMADAYRAYTNADVSFECPKFVSQELYGGLLNTADLMNAISFIYNPLTGKSWTLKVGEISGKALQEIISYMAFGMAEAETRGASVSGMRVLYEAAPQSVDVDLSQGFALANKSALPQNTQGALKGVEINGAPLDPNMLYRVALPQGILDSLDFIYNDPETRKRLQVYDLKDTGVQEWEVLKWYLQQNAPLNASKFSRSGRFVPLQPDMAIYYEDLQTRREGNRVQAKVVVRNVGLSDASARLLSVGYERKPGDYTNTPDPIFLPNKYAVPSLPVGGAATVDVSFELPPQFVSLDVPLYFSLNPSREDAVRSNDQSWVLSLALLKGAQYPKKSAPSASNRAGACSRLARCGRGASY